MLSCDAFGDRIYDEDSRRALQGAAKAPADVAEHMSACTGCARAWSEAGEDLRRLPALLLTPAPLALERRIRIGLAERTAAQPVFDWAQSSAWAALGASLALSAVYTVPALQVVGSVALSLAGASLAFGASLAREALREARS